MSPSAGPQSIHEQRGGRWRRVVLAAVATAAASGALAAAAAPAGASTLYTTDSTGDPTTTFARNQAVYGTGNITYRAPGHIIPVADFYFVPNRTWAAGADLRSENVGPIYRIQRLGTFVDEPLWLPNLQPGRYDIVVDANLNGVYDPATDHVLGAGNDSAIRVTGQTFPGQEPEIAALKLDAGQRASRLGNVSNQHKFASNLAAGSSSFAVANGLFKPTLLGYARSLLGGGVTFYLSKVQNIPFGPYDADAAIGLGMVNETLAIERTRWTRLHNDPADPSYGVPVAANVTAGKTVLADFLDEPGDGRTYPVPATSPAPAAQRSATLANLAVEKTALLDALVDANERYLGAQEATDIRWAVAHARAMHQTIERLTGVETEILGLLNDERTELATMPDASVPVSATLISTLQTRLAATGYTTDERDEYRASGISDTQADELKDAFVAEDPPTADFTPLQSQDDLIDDPEASLTELADLKDQVEDLQDDLQTTVEPVSLPEVDATVPTTVTAGTATTLTATSSGGTGTRTVRWDTDLDGAFDDATGTSASFTPSVPGRHVVGVRVTDQAGLSDTRYVTVDADPSSPAPTVASASPSTSLVDVTPGMSQTFSVSSLAPGATYEWRVDGTVVGTGPSFTMSTGPTDSAYSLVTVTIRSSDPHALRTAHGWTVSVS